MGGTEATDDLSTVVGGRLLAAELSPQETSFLFKLCHVTGLLAERVSAEPAFVAIESVHRGDGPARRDQGVVRKVQVEIGVDDGAAKPALKCLLRRVLLAAQPGAATHRRSEESVNVLSRKLFSVFTAAAIGGTALVAPAMSTPLAHAAEVTAAQTSPEIPDPQLFTNPSLYLLQGDTDTFTPLSDDLPAGTTLTLDEGIALGELRAEGWSVSVTDSVLTVTAPRHAEGYYQIPVIVTFPDQSTQTTAVTMNVDYLADIPLSIWIPAAAYVHLSENSTSSMSSRWP